METRKHIAAEKKRCGSHNCAQAILHTYADIAGIDEELSINWFPGCKTGNVSRYILAILFIFLSKTLTQARLF